MRVSSSLFLCKFEVTATAIHVSLFVNLLPVLYANNLPQQHIRDMSPQVPSYLTHPLRDSSTSGNIFVAVTGT